MIAEANEIAASIVLMMRDHGSSLEIRLRVSLILAIVHTADRWQLRPGDGSPEVVNKLAERLEAKALDVIQGYIVECN